jgi:hypothetical protein
MRLRKEISRILNVSNRFIAYGWYQETERFKGDFAA